MFKFKTSALIVAVVLGSSVFAAGCTATSTRASTGQTIDDSVITAKIKAKLIDDPVTKAREISVETFKGTVQLSGFVETAAERSQAERVAKSVDGVHSVKNSLVLKKTTG
jgi:osmotically-inducible protein OsmY